MPLSKAAKKKYINGASHKCPYCKSENIEGRFVEVTDGGANQKITCNDCGKRWFDLYKLVDIQELED